MATSKLSSHIRRLRPSAFNFLPALSHARQFHYLTNPNPNPNSNLLSPHPPWNSYAFPQTLTFSHSRFLSSSSSDDSDFVQLGVSGADSAAQSELLNLGGCAGEEYLLPVRALISVLDGFHDLTRLPWWVLIDLCFILKLRPKCGIFSIYIYIFKCLDLYALFYIL